MKPQRISTGPITPKSTQDWLTNHSRVLAGNVDFGDTMTNKEQGRNMKCSKNTGTTPAANTEFIVTHGLGRIPITFFGHTNNGGVIYQSRATLGTSTQVFLKCTTATAAYSLVLI
jgi:hypothetical protein